MNQTLTLLMYVSSFNFRHRTFTVSGRAVPRFITCPMTSLPKCDDIVGLCYIRYLKITVTILSFCFSLLVGHGPEVVTREVTFESSFQQRKSHTEVHGGLVQTAFITRGAFDIVCERFHNWVSTPKSFINSLKRISFREYVGFVCAGAIEG